MSEGLILILIVFAIGGFLYLWYMQIVQRRNKALEALSGIDVQLQQRSELIPNILKIAGRMMEHERELMTEITRLRESTVAEYDHANRDELSQHLKAAQQLEQKMGHFMVRMEQYPDIKSSETMLQAQRSYNEVEAHIAAARRFYNSAVTALNNAVQIAPGNIIAGWAGIGPMPFYDAPATANAPVDVSDFLPSA